MYNVSPCFTGFPCNQFGGQEPGSNQQIKKFAEKKYGITFPLFAKTDVNGPGWGGAG